MPSAPREEEVCPSGHKKEKVMTMVTFFHTSVESCGGDHGVSSREGVWPSSSKMETSIEPSSSKSEGSMTMAIPLPSLVKSC